MKGTVYLWVLAAVVAGALVGLVGFVVEGFFSVQSSCMEPVIIGAIASAQKRGPWIWRLIEVEFLHCRAPSQTNELPYEALRDQGEIRNIGS
jgi:hypothetical protein